MVGILKETNLTHLQIYTVIHKYMKKVVMYQEEVHTDSME